MSEAFVMPAITDITELNTIDLTNVEASRAIMKAGDYPFRLDKLELKPQKAPKTGKNLVVHLVSEGPIPNRDAAQPVIQPGRKHSEVVSLAPTPDYNPAERLAALQECFIGKKGPFNVAEILGRSGNVRMKIEEDAEYGTKNRVQQWLKKAPSETSLA